MLNNQPYHRFGPLIALIILGVIWTFFPKDPGIFPLDDAYIHLNYIENLAETGKLSFNSGDLSTGSSSPLWVIILVPFFWLGLDHYWTVITLSSVLLAFATYLTWIITRITVAGFNFSSRIQFWCPLLASLFIVLNGNLIWLSLSGMETMLFLVVGLLGILAYSKWHLKYRTGVICAFLTLAHPSGISLFITLFLMNVVLGKKLESIKGLIAYVLALCPYLIFTFMVNGHIFPTTGRAKTLTYVNSGLDLQEALEFTLAFIEYQKFLPQHIVLLIAMITVSLAYLIIKTSIAHDLIWTLRKWDFDLVSIKKPSTAIISRLTNLPTGISKHLLITSLLVWGIIHFGMYAWTFRILLHHARYLALEHVVSAVTGAVLIAFLHKLIPRGVLSIPASFVALALALVTLFSWGQIYMNNTQHVKDIYIPMSDAISEYTPDGSKIAAFDIGVIGYLTNRHIIDLGGVTSTDAHACLKSRRCGEFLRKSQADYVVYSRNPDVDIYNSIYLAEYQGPKLLKQKPIIHFSTEQYKAPTLTHSHRLDLYQIDGWFSKTPDGIQDAFAYDGMEFQPLWHDIDDHLQFVGYWIDYRVVQKIPQHPLFVNFSYFFKATKTFDQPYWVHMIFTNSDLEEVYLYEKHMPTHNLLKPSRWPIGQVIKDHHIRIITDSLPKQRFRVLVTVTQMPDLDWVNPNDYQWIELGHFENKTNAIAPISW